ncbi:hypothetical protein MN202_04445 [Rheinheimera muenzenbergensis]|uniref:Antitoxin component YwqK of the YwqJK toxin-antitoxin module n=1 Tax=Rheinheimera muenzenbergensis TaxID=1193628 RepID=A0ABU8C3H0_9GAMM
MFLYIKNIFIAVLVIVAALSAAICYADNPVLLQPVPQQNSMATFAKLPGIISPYIEYMPMGRISAEKASEMPHYTVAYDEQQRIVEISFFRGPNPSNNAYFGTHKVKYNYSPEKLVRTYFDTKGEKSVLQRHYYKGGQIHKEEFQLDSQGNKTKLFLYDSTNKRIETGLGTYEFSFEKIDESSFIQQQFKKNGERQILTEYFPFETTLIKLDSLGLLYSITHIHPETHKKELHKAAGYAEVVFDFDQYGNELGWWFLDTEGKLVNRKPFYDIGGHGYARWAYEMDWRDQESGAVHGFIERYYDAKGQAVNNNSGVHEVRYIHNAWGEATVISSFNKKGEKVIDPAYGYFRMTVDYDDLGERISTKKYDANENLINN